MIDTNELRQLAQAASHPTTKGRWMRLFGERTVYDRMEDGCRGILVVSTDKHPPSPFEAACLDFIAAANPAAVSELLDRLEAAERERDNYKVAYNEWTEKTEWVQRGINDGTIPPKYLGWHRADVMSDLLSAAEKDIAHQKALAASALRVAEGWERKCGELRAKIEAMEQQEPPRGWWDDLIADISAIDCMYRGGPIYAHDAYWMRDRVMWTLKQRRDSTPGVKGE